jgi:CheY-like chemotaxis protein
MNSATILVVDDEAQIRRVLRSTLTFRGYEIVEASSGEEGIETARRIKPDLMLLDVNLPGMSGIETCSLFAAPSATRLLPWTLAPTTT